MLQNDQRCHWQKRAEKRYVLDFGWCLPWPRTRFQYKDARILLACLQFWVLHLPTFCRYNAQIKVLAFYCLNVVPFHFALSNSVTLYLEVTDRILSIMVHLLCYNGHNAHTRTYGQCEWVKKSVLYVRFKAPRSSVPRQGRVHTHARTHAIWYVNHWLTLNLVGPVYLSINYWRVYVVLNLPICSLPPTHRINVLSAEHKELGPSPWKEASAAVLRGLTGRPRPGWRSPSPGDRRADWPGWAALPHAAGPPSAPREQTAEMTWCQCG